MDVLPYITILVIAALCVLVAYCMLKVEILTKTVKTLQTERVGVDENTVVGIVRQASKEVLETVTNMLLSKPTPVVTEKPVDEQVGLERFVGERVAERFVTERVGAERVGAERVGAERVAERPTEPESIDMPATVEMTKDENDETFSKDEYWRGIPLPAEELSTRPTSPMYMSERRDSESVEAPEADMEPTVRKVARRKKRAAL